MFRTIYDFFSRSLFFDARFCGQEKSVACSTHWWFAAQYSMLFRPECASYATQTVFTSNRQEKNHKSQVRATAQKKNFSFLNAETALYLMAIHKEMPNHRMQEPFCRWQQALRLSIWHYTVTYRSKITTRICRELSAATDDRLSLNSSSWCTIRQRIAHIREFFYSGSTPQ